MRVWSIGRTLGVAVLSSMLWACGGAGASSGEDPVDDGKADATAQSAEVCFARFTWLQKDAYKETAGRSDPRWPPHTTTQLDVRCGSSVARTAVVATGFRENHGTKPGQKDANGDVFLSEVKHRDVRGTRRELLGLLDAYGRCECDGPGAGATQFLDRDDLQDQAVQQAIASVTEYLSHNLTCTDGVTVEGLIGALARQDLGTALEQLESCDFADGADVGTALNQAFAELMQVSTAQLAVYHVCNNDAELQADLFAKFADGQPSLTCDRASELCKGPHWLYNP
jgi:hypothetical protein